jgi:DNA-binding beta-propeller fold protein YncE
MRLFSMISSQGRARWAQAGGALAFAVLVAGCGDNYRPTVTPVGTSGPPAQPTSYAVVVSVPAASEATCGGASSDGVVTIIDYSGDTIMTEAAIGPGPTAFTLDQQGATGYTINCDGTLSNFSITTTLQAKNVSFSTLSTTAQIVNLMPPSSGLWATDLNGDVIDLFQGSPQAFKLAIPVASPSSNPTMPVFVAGAAALTGQREYVLSQNVGNSATMACNTSPTTQTTGVATPIEISSDTVDPAIPVGKCPVYAVQSPDQQRLFVLNRGDDTITVINTAKNTLDKCPVPLVPVPPSTVPTVCPAPYNTNQNGQPITFHPALPLSLTAVNALNAVTPGSGNPPNGTAGMTAIAGPVYAEYNSATQQLVVANYDGGTISVIDVSLDQYGNDSATFGTTYTIAVGNTATPNPASVTVLYDGSKAYTANQNDGGPNAPNGTVTVVNLSTHTVEKTIGVVGHPRTVVNTQNSEYSKIYVASPDQPEITIIESSPTITDQIDTTVTLEGLPIDIRTTTQTGNSGNNNFSSRVPGYGQPCNLSNGQLALKYGTNYLSTLTLAECQATQ